MYKAGDIFFVRGDSLISNAIKFVTDSDYSHVGIFLDDIHIYHTEYNTVSSIVHLKYPKDKIVVYRLYEEINEEKLRDFIYSHMGNKYDFKEIIKIVLRINTDENDNEYICSTLIRNAFRQQGIELSNKKIPTPEDLFRSKKIFQIQ